MAIMKNKLIAQLKKLISLISQPLISCKTIIGYGSPNKSGKSSSHGAPLGEDEIKLVRKNLNGLILHLKYQMKF